MSTTQEVKPDIIGSDQLATSTQPVIAGGQNILMTILHDRDPSDMDLSELRSVIDEVDLIIMSAFAARLQMTGLISIEKANKGISAIDTRREKDIEQQARSGAQAIGIDPLPVVNIFRSLIQAAHGQHKAARATVERPSTV